MNQELPDVQDGFRKGRGTRDQTANIHWLIDYAEVFDCLDHKKTVENYSRNGNIRPPYLSPEKPVCRSRNKS